MQKLLKNSATAILVPIIGVPFQCASWSVMFRIGIVQHTSEIVETIISGLSVVWFCLPLISLFGIYAGAKYIKANGASVVPIVGIVLNVLWLLAFLFVWFLVFVVGVTA